MEYELNRVFVRCFLAKAAEMDVSNIGIRKVVVCVPMEQIVLFYEDPFASLLVLLMGYLSSSERFR